MNKYITIHCAATPNGKDFDITDIDAWHKQRGFGRNQGWINKFNPDLQHVGYHYVIKLNGEVQQGRHLDELGAHVARFNLDNIGICMIGTDKFTQAQWNALTLLVADLMTAYPTIVSVKGHRDWPYVNKECPGFDVGAWFHDRQPDDNHILEVV